MTKKDELTIDQQTLVEAWQRVLPTTMSKPDRAEVRADESDTRSLRIHIRAAGHQAYTFDFQVTYVDSREVSVALIDVEKSGIAVDERTDEIQELIGDYTRDLHECAQALQQLTHA